MGESNYSLSYLSYTPHSFFFFKILYSIGYSCLVSTAELSFFLKNCPCAEPQSTMPVFRRSSREIFKECFAVRFPTEEVGGSQAAGFSSRYNLPRAESALNTAAYISATKGDNVKSYISEIMLSLFSHSTRVGLVDCDKRFIVTPLN